MPAWILLLPRFGRSTTHGGTYRYDRHSMTMRTI